ncbi:MAG: DUF72 domain-containing protein [Saprospiraceae bacterium]|nr:DUF72 domain-containing protein [Saprospiraceae bacterium]
MEFGKLPDISQVDFLLPADPPGNAEILRNFPVRNPHFVIPVGNLIPNPQSPIRNPKVSGQVPQSLYVGATGWSVKEWVGKIYPKGTKTTEYLRHYSRQFNTIELNTTHYRIPDSFTVQHWHDEAADDFRFCPKVLQTISHAADLGTGGDLIQRFCVAMSGLGNKLGPCFIQLPPYFGVEKIGVLEAFLKQFTLPLAVEVRHESWFSNPLNTDRLIELLKSFSVSTVITDVAGRRDVAHMRLTTDKVLVRFVGNDLHPTDFTRLDDWAERLSHWFSMGLQECYFFTHEPDNLLAPDLAAAFYEKTKAMSGVATRGPKLGGQAAQGPQMSLF